jgi:hypothetical protein
MTRTRSSAKAAGARFERLIADALAVIDDRVDRRVKTGAKDRGDIAGLRSAHGLRVVVECKDTSRTELGSWYREAETEMGNDGAEVAVVAHKRRGVGAGLDQWVTLTVRDLVALISGERP